MKARINYKSRKTIIITCVIAVLLIAAVTGTVAYIKGNNNAAAAMPDDNEQVNLNNGNSNNGDTPQENDNQNNGENVEPNLNGDQNNGTTNNGANNSNTTNQNTNNGTTTAGTTTGTTTTGNNGANVPNQDYTQTTVIPGRDNVLVEQNTKIGWSPISVATYIATANLNIHKPNLELQKYAYLDGDSLEELPINTAVQKGETITYVIKITNKGNEDANGIRTIDSIPEGTELASISEGGELNSDGKIIWKSDIKAGETVIVSFKVIVTADSIDLINNIAKVNGEETPETKTPVITANKTAQIVTIVDKEEVLENRDAKVGETIRYIITAKNASEVAGTTVIKDSIPEGTTFVDGSITENGNFDKENGTITWNNVVVPAKGESYVSFDVIVNEKTTAGEVVKSVSNTATVGNTPTEEVETKVANITGEKFADKTDAKVGDTLTYTIKLTNSGNGDGKVTVTDEVPTGTALVADSITANGSYNEVNKTITWTDVEVEAGKTAEVSFKVTINNDTTKSVTNKAIIDGKTPTEEVETKVANITGAKYVDKSTAKVGDTLTYTIKLTNSGNGDGKVTVTDEVPTGTALVADSITANGSYNEENKTIKWTDVEVKAGKTAEVSFKVTINNDTTKSVTNKAIIDGKTPTEEVETKVANITGAKFVDKSTAKVGDTLTYTIKLTNSGNGDGTVTVTDEVPTGTTLVADSITANGSYNEVNKTITWTDVKVEAGKTAEVSFKATINSDTKTSVTNKAVIDGNKPTEEVETKVANITTVKTSTGKHADGTPVTDGKLLHELDKITYTLTATNSGNADGEVVLTDVIPDGTTLVENSISKPGTIDDNGMITWKVVVPAKNGEVDGKVEVSFTVKINPFKSGDNNVTDENGKTIRKIYNLVATQDGTTITPGTTDEVEKEYVTITVNKTWNDNEKQAQRRPSKIRFKLYAGSDFVEEYDMDTSKNDSYTFAKQPKYNSDGTLIKYNVQEKEINANDLKFYESKHSESTDNNGNKTYNFTNTFRKPTDQKEITVTKIWDDSNDAAQKRPGEITLELNGEEIKLTNTDAEQNDGNKWSTKVTVDVYDENGEEIDYEVTESDDQVPLWYTKSIVDKTTIKNTFKAPIDEKYDITLTKVWKDSKNKANKRPTSIKFDLYKINVEGEKVVVEENIELKGEPKADQWTITRNVQKYDEKANVIKYFVVEKETGSIFYINTDTDTTDLTVTNKFEVPNDKADISVKKVWNDNNNSAKRESVTIRVTGNGKYEDIVLTSENANATDGNVWEKNNVDTKLPKYDSLGNEIDYTFDEVNIPDGYIKTVKDNEITNSLPGIVVTKTVKSVTNKDGNKMDTTGVNQITVNQGDVIEYLITVKNTGTVDLTNVTVTDNLNVYTDQNRPDETTNILLSNGALAKGANLEYTVYYKVTENDVKVNGQTLSNTATAQGSYKDSNDKTNTIKDEDSAYVTIADAPGVEIVKTQTVKRNGKQLDANAKVEPGDVIEYTIKVTNTGNTILQNVVVEDSMIGYTGFELTSGNWNIGALDRAPNNVAIITAKYTVQKSDMKELVSTVKNVATVKTTSTEPKSSEVEVPTEVWKSEISVKKESRLIKPNVNTIEGKAEYGDKIEYTITATNTGRKQGTIDVADKIDPTKTELIDFSKDITNLTEEEYNKLATTKGLTKTLTVEGNDTTSIIFTVRVIAKSGENITNTAGVGKDNTPTSDKGYTVEKKVKVTTKTEIPKITNSNVTIVLDISGSMLKNDVKVPNGGTDIWGRPTYDKKTRIEVARKAVKDFIDTINLPDSGNTGSAVSVVTFRGPSTVHDVTGTEYTNVLSVDDNKNTIATNKTQADYLKAKVDAVKVPSAGGTVISGALQKATEQVNKLKESNKTNKNIVIFVGDGEPQCDGGDISGEAEKLKATGATVYTIGFKNDVKELRNIASDDGKGGKLYYTTSDNVDLSSIFTTIGTTINPGKEEQKESVEGLIELPNIDTSKNITINGKTDTFDSWRESGIINYDEDKKVYFLDTSKFDADESIEIEYFEKN